MRADKYKTFSIRMIMKAFAGIMYEMAPASNPYRGGELIPLVRDKLLSFIQGQNLNDSQRLAFAVLSDQEAYNTVYMWFDDFLQSLPEFQTLNFSKVEREEVLSKEELEHGNFHEIAEKLVKSRKGKGNSYVFVDRNTSIKEAYDFIDLDAFVQNFVNELFNLEKSVNDDCFLCDWGEHDRGKKKCKTCIRNESFTDNFVHENYPRGDRKTVCKKDCPNGYYICCSECNKTDCNAICEEDIATCDKWLYRDGKKRGKKE